ncbi:MAG TPA: hypothetical protein PL045_07315 [Chitinophagaceae bacterium]|nr:hypothetical protein [Chitinophagaceae bacterium]
MKYHILVMMKATPKWLAMSKTYREKFFTDVVYPLFISFTPQLQIQLFSAEAFHANVSDYITIETTELQHHYQFMQQLRSSRIFSDGYFELADVIVSAENGFRKFNEEARKEKKLIMN